MMARPPNCNSEPNQMKGALFHPSADLCVSDLKPIRARRGAKNNGSDTAIATTVVGTPSSTIITRLRVPLRSTRAIATETWKSESRSKRPSGNSAVAASANGRKRGLIFTHALASLSPSWLMLSRAPSRRRHRSRCRHGMRVLRGRSKVPALPRYAGGVRRHQPARWPGLGLA